MRNGLRIAKRAVPELQLRLESVMACELAKRWGVELSSTVQLLVVSGSAWCLRHKKAINFLEVATVNKWLSIQKWSSWPGFYRVELAR